ncbi:hypothetical protein AALO_G00041570 [Alosa alosa]|uniref:Uncharacterized protein n=1 Tax=Alosa alosa TaxID=278164 RepID=A0AAV6HBM3_9TELE|nr:hypothetical protein AALO_G00041570 [Alosa alosa]
MSETVNTGEQQLVESLCCREWDLVLPSVAGVIDLEDPGCATESDAFAAMIHPAVVDFFFRRDKVNWKKLPTPSGPDGQLSPDQTRLCPTGSCLNGPYKVKFWGEHRKPLPSCVVVAIRRKYPSESGVYIGFQEVNEAVDIGLL